jgi:hypothetical protein
VDDELRDAERAARERGDAASYLRLAAALRRAGRAMEGAAAAFTARGLGASRDEVFPLGQPLEGGGDALAPWPHPRGNSAGNGQSRVEGPGAGARVLFRVSLEGSPLLATPPLVLPDGSVVMGLGGAAPAGSTPGTVLAAFDPGGAPRWRTVLSEPASPLVLTATGDIALSGERQLLRVRAADGKLEDGVDLVRRSAGEPVGLDHLATRAPTAWNRSLIVRESVVRGSSVETLRGERDERLYVRGTPVATSDGWAYACGSTYRMGKPEAPGRAPPLLVDRPAVFAFGREGELRWVKPLPEVPRVQRPSVQLSAGRERLYVQVQTRLVAFERGTGKALGEGALAVPFLALDADDEPIPHAPFGPPLLGAPVVDAAGRRYAPSRANGVVGLDAAGAPLFAIDSIPGVHRIVIAPGRLYCVARGELVCIGLT